MHPGARVKGHRKFTFPAVTSAAAVLLWDGTILPHIGPVKRVIPYVVLFLLTALVPFPQAHRRFIRGLSPY
jgi:hypothetical protein